MNSKRILYYSSIVFAILSTSLFAISNTDKSVIAQQTKDNSSTNQIASLNENQVKSLSGRIVSMLMPVSSEGMGMMESNSSMKNMMMMTMQDETQAKAMQFSMAQDVTWLLSGNWTFSLNYNSADFESVFEKITTDGTMKHLHMIDNFTGSQIANANNNMQNEGNDELVVSGKADVYFDNDLAWKQANMNLTLINDEVLRIDIQSKDIDEHFHGQSIYGTIP